MTVVYEVCKMACLEINNVRRSGISLIPVISIILKFLLFGAIWCSYTTFTPFSRFETYATSILAGLILSIPYILSRKFWTSLLVMIVLDIWFISNLLYYRTYYSPIPLSSYGLIGNLADFVPSVTASFRIIDLIFPLTTICAVLIWRFYKSIIAVRLRAVVVSFIVFCVAFGIDLTARGGFVKAYYDIRQNAYLYASGPVLYTPFGSLYYDYAHQVADLTDEQKTEIYQWLDDAPEIKPVCGIEQRDNCIIIFAESFENWVLNLTVEGQEITPYLNKLISEPNTLYASKVVTQVNGGRSIDAQLLILAGLFPIQTGCYSSTYGQNTFFTLPKAMKEIKGTRNYLMTVDKLTTWNQGVVAKSFGADTLISYPDFKLTEAFGNRKKLADVPFFEQCKEKMERGEVWKPGENVYIQMVTYSGHTPFKIPEHLKKVHFSDDIPEMMADFMTAAHYTDEAIGKFVEYFKTRPEYTNTMIVITGDHEGLADNRERLCNSKAGKGIVSDKEYTPLIVVNSPVAMRYDKVMGQIDIYSTLLNLLGLENYKWKGLGQSILSEDKPAVAISPKRGLQGDTAAVSSDYINRVKQAPEISDKIIRYDLLKDR